MRWLSGRVLCVVLCVLIVCAGCASSGGSSLRGEHLPGYEKMTSQIGRTKAEVLESLGFKETDLTEFVTNDYDLPEEVQYAGVKLTPALAFNYFEDALNAVKYRAVYQGEPERAAKEIFAVANELNKLVGTPDVVGSHAIFDLTEKEIFSAITEEKYLDNEDCWDITESASDNVKSYIEKLMDSPSWDAYRDRSAKYYLLMNISYLEESDTTYLTVSYAVRPEQKKQ